MLTVQQYFSQTDTLVPKTCTGMITTGKCMFTENKNKRKKPKRNTAFLKDGKTPTAMKLQNCCELLSRSCLLAKLSSLF